MKNLIIVILLAGLATTSSADTFRIEIDYMVDTSLGNAHSHMPTQAEIDAVVQMFACQGHTLIIDVDDQITHYDVLQLDPNDRDNFFGFSGTNDSFKAIKDANFDNGDGWHYAIFGHQYEWRRQETDGSWTYFDSGSSGLGERGGDDFVVTLGTFSGQTGTPFDKASTLAHEFGHNLGLSHCGVSDCSDIGPNMPNLGSVMSYNYQLEGVRSGLLCNQLIPESADWLFKELDYSGGRLCPLDETNLDETVGTLFRAVDWDCDGSLSTSTSQDLSTDGPTWCSNAGNLETIADFNEWGSIQSNAAMSPDLLRTQRFPLEPCITSEEVTALRRKAECAQPTLSTESCVSGRTYWVKGSGSSSGTGSCNRAVDTVARGLAVSTPNSALILEPRTYSESGATGLVIDEDIVIYSAKSTIIR